MVAMVGRKSNTVRKGCRYTIPSTGVYTIYSNKKLLVKRATISKFMPLLLAIVGVEVIVLVLWSAVEPPREIIEMYEDPLVRASVERTVCSTASEDGMALLSTGYKGFMLLVGCGILYLVRNCDDRIAEVRFCFPFPSHYIHTYTYNIV